jgi:hypothetical protein
VQSIKLQEVSMSYYWNAGDNDASITTGTAGLNFGGVIQKPDAYGGYNTQFSIHGSTALYHVHFFSGGKRVSIVRYFATSASQGNNIIKWHSGDKLNFNALRNECGIQYPNHQTLLELFHAAIADADTTRSGELAQTVP